jgi:hypothetical protein
MNERATCTQCRGVGWLLNELHAGAIPGPDDPITLDLIPCDYPECNAPQTRGGATRPIATLGIRGQFRTVVRHPRNNNITALTDFTEAAHR